MTIKEFKLHLRWIKKIEKESSIYDIRIQDNQLSIGSSTLGMSIPFPAAGSATVGIGQLDMLIKGLKNTEKITSRIEGESLILSAGVKILHLDISDEAGKEDLHYEEVGKFTNFEKLKIASEFVKVDDMQPSRRFIVLRNDWIAATDNHRVYSSHIDSHFKEDQMIHYYAASILSGDFTISREGNCYKLTDETGVSFYYQTSESFPNFQVVKPDIREMNYITLPNKFQDLVKVASTMNAATKQFWIEIKEQGVEFRADDLDYNLSIRETLKGVIAASPADKDPYIKIAMNADFVLHVLKFADPILYYTTPKRALYFGTDEFLIMPIVKLN